MCNYINAADPRLSTLPRKPEEPTPQEVFDRMAVCEPYTVADLEDEWEDASRWTIQRRLDALVDEDRIQKKKHAKNRVTYWIPDQG